MELPKQWEEILNQSEELKEMFKEHQELEEDEIIPPFFFHYFRPDRCNELKPFFEPFKYGDEMFHKIEEIFLATADNYYDEDEDAVAAYFTVKECSKNETAIKEIAKKHLNCINTILKETEEEKQIEIEKIEIIFMKSYEFNKQYTYEDIFQCDLNDIIFDWFIEVMEDSEDSPLQEFDDALYYIACDYNLQRYVEWSLTKKEEAENPFTPYFKLWKAGYTPHVIDNKVLVLTY